jgi:hypothetical protein
MVGFDSIGYILDFIGGSYRCPTIFLYDSSWHICLEDFLDVGCLTSGKCSWEFIEFFQKIEIFKFTNISLVPIELITKLKKDYHLDLPFYIYVFDVQIP